MKFCIKKRRGPAGTGLYLRYMTGRDPYITPQDVVSGSSLLTFDTGDQAQKYIERYGTLCGPHAVVATIKVVGDDIQIRELAS